LIKQAVGAAGFEGMNLLETQIHATFAPEDYRVIADISPVPQMHGPVTERRNWFCLKRKDRPNNGY
jgi:hypothetical protein